MNPDENNLKTLKNSKTKVYLNIFDSVLKNIYMKLITLPGINNPLNRGIRLFNSKINCYDKNNVITAQTYKNRLKNM
jgi:hypothetical protein